MSALPPTRRKRDNVNTFQVIGKSPARRTDGKRVYYVTNIRTGYGVWNRVVGAKVADVLADAEEMVNAQPNRQTFTASRDAIADALGDVQTWQDYNRPDNY